jgi:hypothetical protein
MYAAGNTAMNLHIYGSRFLTKTFTTLSDSNPQPPTSAFKMSLSIIDSTPSLQSLAPTPPQHFRDLPKEVRDKIYYFLLQQPAGVCYPTNQPISM